MDENALAARARVYQDGLQVRGRSPSWRRTDEQSSDGAEDTTFCVRLVRGKQGWGGKRPYPWEIEDDAATMQAATDKASVRSQSAEPVKVKAKSSRFYVPPLTTTAPQLLIFRARSKVSLADSAALMIVGEGQVDLGD